MPDQTFRFLTAGSSNLEAVDWDGQTDTLTVTFQGGERYDYFNVPRAVALQFSQAPSFGSFFHRHIKGRYSYEQR